MEGGVSALVFRYRVKGYQGWMTMIADAAECNEQQGRETLKAKFGDRLEAAELLVPVPVARPAQAVTQQQVEVDV